MSIDFTLVWHAVGAKISSLAFPIEGATYNNHEGYIVSSKEKVSF